MLIILDRDGVINHDSTDYIKSPKEWMAIPGSLEAIAALNKAGHQVVVATNQSGVGRGYFSLDTLDAIHQKMEKELAAVGGELAGIYSCLHHPDEGCECRKPKPGLLKQIEKDFGVDITQALVVGDSLRDIEAAQAAGCIAVLVETGKPIPSPLPLKMQKVPIFSNLAQVVEGVLGDASLGNFSRSH